ncbi:MAG: Cell wall-associated hydrolase, invasion-associated protein, partial [Blastococcus sp.]|nr:Cell wall-associated hydrolase, invasion-associated protein [Blastococcus sp.]
GSRPQRRPPGGTRRPAARRPASRRTVSRPGKKTQDGARSAWSTRVGVVAMSTLLLAAAVAMLLPGATGGGQDGGPLDATALALTAQTSLLQDAGHYRQLEQEAALRRAELQRARDAEQAALALVTAHQAVVGATAADLYRSPPADRYPMLALDAQQPSATSDVLFRQALAEQADRELEGAVVRAERTTAQLEAAGRRVAEAEAAVAAVSDRAAGVLSTVRAKVEDLTPEVTARLAALGTVAAAGAQQDRNQQATLRWQDYLGRLAAAGIEPPPAASLTGSTDMPRGLSPALDAAGQPIPGVAWAVLGSSPVTVLPAETIAAVSTALSQLGKPFAPGTSGPDAYDCGGFTAASWLLGGYAVPSTPQEQWSTGAAVPLTDLQVGDLVFAPGGQDVGIYLGNGDVVGASAANFQVGVHSMAAGSAATRVTLPAPAQPNGARPPGGGTGACGAALPAPGTATPAWGGFSNGQIPREALCQLGVYRHALRCDAAASYGQLSAAFQTAFGTPLCITDSYRSLASQVSAFRRKPKLAAVPGTSNHGWALAVDLCGGINTAGSPQWTWMTANAGRFGFVQPDWAAPRGEKPEAWHWEYGYIS